jgi:DNA transposition AAA+ family ATPase
MSDTSGENMPAPERVASDTVRASWNFSLDHIRENTTHFSPDEQEALVALFRWCIDPQHPIRRDEAARRLKCSTELIYQLLTGKYREPGPDKKPKRPSAEFMDNLREFLAVEAKRFSSISTDFVITPTARKIFTACELARESRSPVILSGPSHIGKTLALRYYQAHNNHGRTFLAELDSCGGRGGMMRTLAKACGITDSKDSTESLKERIKTALASDVILIIDEMHLLKHTYRMNSFFACVEDIRRIYDFKLCGMVLCWTNLLDLKNASQDELVQIWRRGVHKVAMPVMPTKADLTAILGHHGLAFPDRKFEITVSGITECPHEILRQQAKTAGLKAITERLRYAEKLAAKKDGKIGWTHFVDAHLRIEKQAVAEEEWT